MDKTINIYVLNVLFFIFCLIPDISAVNHDDNTSFYSASPASDWHEAFPIGNGHIGAMVYGGIQKERVQTNECTFWAGGPRRLQKDGAYNDVVYVRKLIAKGKTAEAEKVINSKIVGPYYHSYMPFADINFDFDLPSADCSDYRRTLDMSNGIISVEYESDGKKFRREYYVSYPDKALFVRLTCDEPLLNFDVSLGSRVKHKTYVSGEDVVIEGQAPDVCWPHYENNDEILYSDTCGMHFQARLFVKRNDGKVSYSDSVMHISDAREVVLVFVGATSFNGFGKDPIKFGKNPQEICLSREKHIMRKEYKNIYSDHIDDFSSMFGRVSIDLGQDKMASRPIEERIRNYSHSSDPSLTALYFQFGRYLLMSSSRPDGQPANLQGIWCDDMHSAWSCNYTLNCNVEINYWIAECANLSECHLPLMKMIREASVDGARTARVLYDCSGWTVHHNLDLWRTTWPVGKSGQWGIYQAAPAWLCHHIWEHYEFTRDKDFLREYYPVMEGAARFYTESLQMSSDGYLVTNPAVSFENTYRKPDGTVGWACMGPSADMQMIRVLFEHIMDVEAVLGVRSDVADKVRKMYHRLAPMKISGRTGELQEWYDDWDNRNDDNGQVAHGWGAVASDIIDPYRTPALADAFRKVLDKRSPMYKSNSGSWTGSFAAAWWARYGEPDSLQKTIDRHFQKALYPNLTSQFHNYFQIDGNLGFAFAVSEMLMQSHSDEIRLLPALPSKYPDGKICGLKARGNLTVDIEWHGMKLDRAVIKGCSGQSVNVRYGNLLKSFIIPASGKLVLDRMLNICSID